MVARVGCESLLVESWKVVVINLLVDSLEVVVGDWPAMIIEDGVLKLVERIFQLLKQIPVWSKNNNDTWVIFNQNPNHLALNKSLMLSSNLPLAHTTGVRGSV